jgi:DNA-binding XRE family transcriptional regulator
MAVWINEKTSPEKKEEALKSLMELPIGSWEAADFLDAREGLDLTQAEFATAIGYDRSAIAKIEGGDAPPRLVVELAVRYRIDHRPRGLEFKAKDPLPLEPRP